MKLEVVVVTNEFYDAFHQTVLQSLRLPCAAYLRFYNSLNAELGCVQLEMPAVHDNLTIFASAVLVASKVSNLLQLLHEVP